MDTINIRIDLGDVQVIVGGQSVTGRGRARVGIDRAQLIALLGGGIATPVALEPATLPAGEQEATIPAQTPPDAHFELPREAAVVEETPVVAPPSR